jgi:hypothetical protein
MLLPSELRLLGTVPALNVTSPLIMPLPPRPAHFPDDTQSHGSGAARSRCARCRDMDGL